MFLFVLAVGTRGRVYKFVEQGGSVLVLVMKYLIQFQVHSGALECVLGLVQAGRLGEWLELRA